MTELYLDICHPRHLYLSGYSYPGVRVLCPTRWTVRAEALASIINDFDSLQRTWKEAAEVIRNTKTKARIRGVSAVMNTFNFLFGCMLDEVILKHSDNLSSMLQHKSLSAAEYIAQMTIETLKSVRSDDSLDLFWQKVSTKPSELDIGDPELPSRHRLPWRLDDGESASTFSRICLRAVASNFEVVRPGSRCGHMTRLLNNEYT